MRGAALWALPSGGSEPSTSHSIQSLLAPVPVGLPEVLTEWLTPSTRSALPFHPSPDGFMTSGRGSRGMQGAAEEAQVVVAPGEGGKPEQAGFVAAPPPPGSASCSAPCSSGAPIISLVRALPTRGAPCPPGSVGGSATADLRAAIGRRAFRNPLYELDTSAMATVPSARRTVGDLERTDHGKSAFRQVPALFPEDSILRFVQQYPQAQMRREGEQ